MGLPPRSPVRTPRSCARRSQLRAGRRAPVLLEVRPVERNNDLVAVSHDESRPGRDQRGRVNRTIAEKASYLLHAVARPRPCELRRALADRVHARRRCPENACPAVADGEDSARVACRSPAKRVSTGCFEIWSSLEGCDAAMAAREDLRPREGTGLVAPWQNHGISQGRVRSTPSRVTESILARRSSPWGLGRNVTVPRWPA